MTALVSQGARDLVTRSIDPTDRVLITGASGWLGRTALDLLEPLAIPVLPLASRARTIRVAGRDVDVAEWDEAVVASFAPTVVLDCAFLTRDRISDVPLGDYVAANRTLTRRMLTAAQLGDVRLVLTVSSGAAVHPADALDSSLEDNPYGYLKREAEYLLTEAVAGRHAVPVVARAWSISGAHVQRPENYALGSMIRAAYSGAVHIAARRLVFRRYALADELLAIALAEGRRGAATVESGGELVEMSELARRVVAMVNPRATITREEVDPANPDEYHSDGRDWLARCAHWGLTPTPLDAQIELTARGVLER